MDFEYVLAELLSRVEGALGVLFLDWEGEAVDVLGSTGSIHDIKVLGAYQGIFLAQLRGHCDALGLGSCRELGLRIGSETFLTRPLPEGYYLTLILGEDALVGRARREMDHAVERMTEILF